MKTCLNYFSLLSLTIFGLIAFTSCTKDEEVVLDEAAAFNIQVINSSKFGYILTNQNKQSIYFFAGDVTGQSNCTGGCADTWPAVIGNIAELDLSSNLDRSDFGTFIREDGQKQITYKGWPLYYFSPEKNKILELPGETLGDAKGGVFHIAKPDYTVLLGRKVVTEGEEAVVYLVDDRGVTLYLNQADELNKSNCTGGLC